MDSFLVLVAIVVNPSLSVWLLVEGLCVFIDILYLVRHSCLDFQSAVSITRFSS